MQILAVFPGVSGICLVEVFLYFLANKYSGFQKSDITNENCIYFALNIKKSLQIIVFM